MSLPTAHCKECGEKNIKITAGPTGKPLIDCPKCNGKNVLEDGQTELTTYFIGKEKDTSRRGSKSKNEKKQGKKQGIIVKKLYVEHEQSDENQALPEHNLETIVEEALKSYQELEDQEERKIVEEHVSPRKRSRKSSVDATTKKPRQRRNKQEPEIDCVQNSTSNCNGAESTVKTCDNSIFNVLVHTKCWNCHVVLSNHIEFPKNHLTREFFCPYCGVPQTFICSCGILNSLVANYCMGCGTKPIMQQPQQTGKMMKTSLK